MPKGFKKSAPLIILLIGILFLFYYAQGSIVGFFLAAGKLSATIEESGENGYLVTVSNFGETEIENISVYVFLPGNSNITNPSDASVEETRLYWGVERLGTGEKKTLNFTAEAVGQIRVEAEGAGLVERTEQFPIGREFDSGYYNISFSGVERPVSLSLKISTRVLETTTAAMESTTTSSTTTESTTSGGNTTAAAVNTTVNETAISITANTTSTTAIETLNATTTSTVLESTTVQTNETSTTATEKEEKKEKENKQEGTGNFLAESPGTVWIDLDWEDGNEYLVFDGVEGEGVYPIEKNTTELRVLFRPREGFKQILEYYEITHLVKGPVKAVGKIEVKKREKLWTKGNELELEDWFVRENTDIVEKSAEPNYSAITEGFVDSRGLLLRVDTPLTLYGKVYRGQNSPVQLDFYFKTEYPSDCQIGSTGIEVLFENEDGDTTYILGINANNTLSIEPQLDPDFSGKIENADFGWQHVSASTRKAVPQDRFYRPFVRPGSVSCLSGFESFIVSGFSVK